MKIGLVTNLMDAHRAGVSRYAKNVTENLLKIDQSNEYLLIHSNKKKYQFKGNYKEIRLPFFDSIPKKLITGTLALEKICQQENLDILHDLGQIGPYWFKSKTKRILTIFDLSVYKYPKTFTWLTRTYSKLLPLAAKKVDKIMTISEASKKDIVKYLKVNPSKVKVTYLGIEKQFRPINNQTQLQRVKKKYQLPNKYILFVGTIEPRKNLTSLIKNDTLKNCHLVVVGKKGWLSNDIYKLPEKLGIKNKVKFIGQTDDTDLPAIYNLAQVLVYPSLYEGFGLPVLEAMACGCPVITSNISSLPEVVGKAGVLINPIDEKEISKAIKDILTKPFLRLSLIKKGFLQVKKFSFEKCAKETLKVYHGYN